MRGADRDDPNYVAHCCPTSILAHHALKTEQPIVRSASSSDLPETNINRIHRASLACFCSIKSFVLLSVVTSDDVILHSG